MGKKTIKYTYCKVCKKEISNPVKKSMDSMEKTIWIVVFLATLGIAVIPYLFYIKLVRKKNYCPNCETELIHSKEPFEKPKKNSERKKAKLTPKEKVLEKVEAKKAKKKELIRKTREEKEEAETIICPFCGERLEKDIATCPFCKTAIKF